MGLGLGLALGLGLRLGLGCANPSPNLNQAAKRLKHEATCRGIAEQLVALAGRVTDVRASAQPLLPPKARTLTLTLTLTLTSPQP